MADIRLDTNLTGKGYNKKVGNAGNEELVQKSKVSDETGALNTDLKVKSEDPVVLAKNDKVVRESTIGDANATLNRVSEESTEIAFNPSIVDEEIDNVGLAAMKKGDDVD